jgi:hypothetical protein
MAVQKRASGRKQSPLPAKTNKIIVFSKSLSWGICFEYPLFSKRLVETVYGRK